MQAATFETVRNQLAEATADQKKTIAADLGLVQPVGDRGRVILWVAVLAVLAGIFFFSAWLTYERSVDDKTLAPFSEFAALVVGGIVGLVAPSPISKTG